MATHPNRLTLERYSVDDLPAPARERTAEHVGACLPCQRYLGELAAVSHARLAAVPPAEFLERLAVRRGRAATVARWRWAGFAGAALAAAATLLFAVRPASGPDSGLGVRWKGAGVTVHRKRGPETRVLAPGEGVRAGDALRIVVALPRPALVGVWFLDAAGRVDRFSPEGSTELAAGEHALSGSAVVDAPCRDLWLIVASGAAAVRNAESAFAGHPTGRASLVATPPDGVIVRRLGCE